MKEISEEDQKRIRNDAYIANDALMSIMYAQVITPDYLAEKTGVIQRCLDFMKNFAEVKK